MSSLTAASAVLPGSWVECRDDVGDGTRLSVGDSKRDRGRRNDLTQHVVALMQTADESERQTLIKRLTEINLPMADAIASRYSRRGVAIEDLQQVARMAMLHAAQRFNPHADNSFAAFASPTIHGEIKRYFRDHAWVIRPTRRVQEMQHQVRRAVDELSRDSSREPTLREIAAHLGVDPTDVEQAMSVRGHFAPTSLDSMYDGATAHQEYFVEPANPQSAVEARTMLQAPISRLSERDKGLLRMRFVEQLTQQEIAEREGVTQMQISRLLKRVLDTLRDDIGDVESPSDPAAP